jgi:hypothetical protein
VRSTPRLLAAVLLAGATAVACTGKPLTIPTRPPSASANATAGVSASASETPVPSASASAGQAAVDGLIARLQSARFSYQVAVKGDVLATVSDLTLKGSISMAGTDVASTMTYTFADGATDKIETRIVGAKRWLRVDGGAWKSVALAAANKVDPFAGALAPGAITDYGPKTLNGKVLRSVQIRGGLLLDLTTIPAYNLTDERITSSLLAIVVDPTGRPVSGRWTQRGQGRVSGQLQEVDVDADVTFSKVGTAVTIKAP